MLIRKNIWILFYLFFIAAAILLAFISYYKYQTLKQEVYTTQENHVEIIATAFHSILLQYESSLDILGSQLLINKSYKDHDRSQAFIDAILAKNPELAAYGLADINGNFLITSSNVDISKMPNLATAPLTAKTFHQALNQDTMILGRTYFAKGIGHWLIPLRKAIHDRDGNLLGVMTTGIKIDDNESFLQKKLFSSKQHIRLIKDSNPMYRQYAPDNIFPNNEVLYNEPVLTKQISFAQKELQQQYGITLVDLKKHPKSVALMLQAYHNKKMITGIKYDPRFKLWYLVSLDKADYFNVFLDSFIFYLSIFLISFIIFFFLFKEIYKSDNRTRERLQFQAEHDALTLLPNRTALKSYFQIYCEKYPQGFLLLFADLDHFKHINDRFGHLVGDKLLVKVAQRFQRYLHKEDVVVRQSGDEFILLLHPTDEMLDLRLKTLITHMTQPYKINDLELNIGMSLGITQCISDSDNLYELMSYADIALYQAKKVKNTWMAFSDSMRKRILNHAQIESHLRHAVEREELWMVYQPQICADGKFHGVEALIRWENSTLGLVPPHRFIPIAEESGLMTHIGDFIRNTAFKEISECQNELNISFELSINVSIREFIENNFVEKLSEQVKAHGLEPQSITLEVTETLFIEDLDYLLPIIHQCKALGFKFSLDDFGTGYSSLSILRTLPIQELKIDKSFIDELIHNSQASRLAKNIIMIGEDLSLDTLAEGTENREQVELLKSFGCKLFQGYYFSKPLRIDALKTFLTDKKRFF